MPAWSARNSNIDRLAGAGALGDAVLIDGEAVRHVAAREGDLDEIVLLDFDRGGEKAYGRRRR